MDLMHWSKHTVKNVMLHWSHRILSRSWRSFKQYVNEAIIQQSSVAHVISTWVYREQATAFNTWISHCSWQRGMSQQAELQAIRDAELQAVREAERKQLLREQDLQAQRESELQELRSAELRLAQKEAEQQTKREAVLQAKREGEQRLAVQEAELEEERIAELKEKNEAERRLSEREAALEARKEAELTRKQEAERRLAEREAELEAKRDAELKEMREAERKLADREAELDARRQQGQQSKLEAQRKLAERASGLEVQRLADIEEAELQADLQQEADLIWFKKSAAKALRTWQGLTRLGLYSVRLNETASISWRYHKMKAAILELRQYAKYINAEKREATEAHAAALKELAHPAVSVNVQPLSAVPPHRRSPMTSPGSSTAVKDVRIPRTRTARDNGKPCVFFVLEVQGRDENSSYQVPRRYRDFDHLDKMIREKFSFIDDLPCLPPKKSFGALDPHFISSRKITLQQYISDMLQMSELKQCDELCAFLDQDLTIWQQFLH